MDLEYIKNLILDTDEKVLRVGEQEYESEFPDTKLTYSDLLDDLMCRLIEHLDIRNTVNYWHSTIDCHYPILPDFQRDD